MSDGLELNGRQALVTGGIHGDSEACTISRTAVYFDDALLVNEVENR